MAPFKQKVGRRGGEGVPTSLTTTTTTKRASPTNKMGLAGELMKVANSKAMVIKINLVFITLFLVVYTTLILQPPPPSPTIYGGGIAGGHHHIRKVQREVDDGKPIPSFLAGLHGGPGRVGLVNMAGEEMRGWDSVKVEFERVSDGLNWKNLFPEWIDEEEENVRPTCPEMPMPDFSAYGEVDVVAARVPCRAPEEGWARDVVRLQVHLVAANMAVRRGRRDERGRVRVALASACRPMMEVFRCDDMVARDGEWWVYEVDAALLAEKVAMPVGSCMLALPLRREGTNEAYDPSNLAAAAPFAGRREAYATVLHSSDAYICGAITLAQSILAAGTTRDLVLLHDRSIPAPKLAALVAAGWRLHLIQRIRNPRAEKDSYNEYNYSKLRLWQLTQYHKIVFVDADVLVLRSLDILFRFPQLSAAGNDGVIFNSGVMIIEPSNCTFQALMSLRRDVVSYNGGDQGFLNEVFVWWHRLPRRVNFLKNFWSNKTSEFAAKNALFGAEPPELYTIHYLGLKPWVCYRDYDCNFNVGDHRVYASDVAHQRWWRVHDQMDERLQAFCGLTPGRKGSLERDRKSAKELGVGDGHWRMRITDKRKDH